MVVCPFAVTCRWSPKKWLYGIRKKMQEINSKTGAFVPRTESSGLEIVIWITQSFTWVQSITNGRSILLRIHLLQSVSVTVFRKQHPLHTRHVWQKLTSIDATNNRVTSISLHSDSRRSTPCSTELSLATSCMLE